MTKVALRGLAQRKLRAFVTILAVLLGVAFISGSYVLTDTINKSFDDIFDEAYAGTDVAISSSTTGQTDAADLPAFSARYLEHGASRCDGVEKAAGGIFSTGRFVDAKGDPLSNSFAPEFISSVAPKPFETLTYLDGAARRERDTEASHRPVDRRPRGPRAGRHAADRRRGRGQGLRIIGDPAAGRHLFGRVGHRAADPAGGPAPDRQGGRVRRHLRQGGGRGDAAQLLPAHRRGAARAPHGGDGQSGGRAPVPGHQGRPQLPSHRAARVRRRGAAGGQLPDLQHLLDHGRPAHPRVRNAAHARRHARADPPRRWCSRRWSSACSASVLGVPGRDRRRRRPSTRSSRASGSTCPTPAP